MDPMPVIFDISSDEEPCCDEPKGDDYNWLSELLNAVDKVTDDSDEVVVVGEVNPKQRSKSWKSTAKDEDDDCVVLDGDPDNPVPFVNDSAGGSDEVLIVGEKGQIACRDYPHPRHLCAKFPFNSSLHESYCDLCHCYVCDSPAPCVHWGAGMLDFDHCHATDKEEKWKAQRKCFKQGKNARQLVSKVPEASVSIALSQPNQVSQLHKIPQINQVQHVNQVPPLNIIRLAPNSIQQNQGSRLPAIRACSSSTTFGVPNNISQGRGRQSGNVPPKNRLQQHLVSQQLLGVCNNVVRRDRGHDIGNLGSQFVSSRPMFKRSGSGSVGGVMAMNRSGYGSSNSINRAYASQYSKNAPPMAASNNKIPSRWQNVHPSKNLESDTYESSSQPNMASIFANTVSSPPQVYVQPLPQMNNSQNINQHNNQTQDVPDFSNFGISWDNSTSQSSQQPPVESCQQPPVESCQLQSAETTYEPSPVMEFNSQVPGSMNLSSLGVEFENWLAEAHSVPVVSESVVPPEVNILSPEPAPIDVGMLLFDFETSWNGLTQA